MEGEKIFAGVLLCTVVAILLFASSEPEPDNTPSRQPVPEQPAEPRVVREAWSVTYSCPSVKHTADLPSAQVAETILGELTGLGFDAKIRQFKITKLTRYGKPASYMVWRVYYELRDGERREFDTEQEAEKLKWRLVDLECEVNVNKIRRVNW